MPSGTITLLLTDIEGSTKRWAAHADLMRAAVALHDSILVESAARYHGHDLRKKGEGDSRFIVFERAHDAVNAAIEMQMRLQAEEWGPLSPLKIRIALHTAEAELRDEDYFGPGVNRCARMRAAAHGGQIIISSGTKMLVADSLPEGVTLKDLGLHIFKDISQPDRIFQVIVPDLITVTTPLSSLSATRHNLPIQLSTFVGREKQITAVKGILSSFRRLTTIRGPGGIGKTRLAVQVAAEVYDDYPDGVWFVPLAALQDPQLVSQAIAESLPIGFADKEPLAAIVDEFREARALFVIDNCEHLDRSVAEVLNHVLRSCPQIQVIATSREPLGVAGELDFNVPSMAWDLESKQATVESVGKLEAVRLFMDRAKSRLGDGEILTEETAQDIANIVKKLGGIPLAIEQAAAALSHMAPREILDRITRHFSALKLDEIGVEDRHKTIQATIDWSFSRLSNDEKTLFTSLSVFTGGWNREAAEFVCQSARMALDKVGDVLEMLVKRSLVVSELLPGWRINRYRLLEPIREYAESKRDIKDDPTLFEKHFEWFLNVCEQAHHAGLDADNARYDKWLSADQENIRSSLDWGLNNSRPNNECLKFSIWMHRYWIRHDLIREGLSWMQRSMDASQTIDAPLRAEALNILGALAWQGGDLVAARKAFQASIEIYTSLGDEIGAAKSSANLGGIAFYEQDFETSANSYARSAKVFRSLGDQQRLASALENQGVSECWLEGRLPAAIEHLSEGTNLARVLENRGGLCQCLYSLLGVHAMYGDLMDRMDLFLEGSELAMQINDPFTSENYLDLSARICLELKEPRMAAQCVGAMELASEKAERKVIQKQRNSRDQLMKVIRDLMGFQHFQRALREGRGIGPTPMLGFVRQLITGEE
jgi:predicted ATPase/class 3 adenylate cyclase